MASALAMYLESKQAFATLISGDNQQAVVPACPDWTVRDLLAHQVGALQDVMSGNVEGLGTAAWTAAQIARFDGASTPEITRAWDAAVTTAGDDMDGIAGNLLPDIVIHEHDLHGALGSQGNRESPALEAAFRFVIGSQNGAFRTGGVPSLMVHAGPHVVQIGDGEPAGALTTTLFEASRVVSGRRSRGQIQELDWSTDPAPWLDHISVFPPRQDDLVE